MSRALVRSTITRAVIGFLVGAGFALLGTVLLSLWHRQGATPLPSLPALASILILTGAVFAAIEAAFEFDSFVAAFAGLIDWFWKSPAIRWGMIFLCAFVYVMMSRPIAFWLLFGGPYPATLIAQTAKPMPEGAFWLISGVATAIPYFLACVRVSEAFDIRKGRPWPLEGPAWWKGGLRTIGRAIYLIPVTLFAGAIGWEISVWGMVGTIKIAPASRPFFESLRNFVIEAFVALVIVSAWWLCSRLIGDKSQHDNSDVVTGASAAKAFVGAVGKVAALVRGFLYIGLAAGLVAVAWWQGDINSSDGTDIFGLSDSLAKAAEFFQLLFYLSALGCVFMAVREWNTALSSTPKVGGPSQGMPKADFADKKNAERAARRSSEREDLTGLDLDY